MNTEQLEALVKEVRDKLAALPSQQQIVEATSEERLKALVRPMLDDIVSADDFKRKMRFGGRGVGSKYERLGLTTADVEFLYDIRQSLQGQRRVDGAGLYGPPSEELTRAFQDLSDARYGPADDDFDGPNTRAMDTAESGYGSQLIGAQYVGELWEAARAQSMVFSLFETFEMTAPTVYLPVEVDIPALLFVGQSTANNSSNYGTSKTGSNRVTVTAKKFVIHQMWSGEMEEDSIIPFIPFLRRQATKSLAYYSDALLINGDDTNAATGNINEVDADPTDTNYYLAFDGLRHACITDNTGNLVNHSAAAITWDAAFDLREKCLDRTYLHDWSNPQDPNDLVYISMPEVTHDLAKMDEVITVDKYGAAATVLTGEVAKIGRNPVVSSIALAKAQAAGTVSTTAGNNTLGQLLTVNRRGGVVGWRRRVKIETERLPATDQTRIVYSMRLGLGRFTPTGAASGIEWVAMLRNIAI